MPAETDPLVKNETSRGLLDRISRSKAVRIGAASLALAGISAGAVKGMEAANHHPTAIEYAHDTSGFKAETQKDNLNNPNTIFRLVGDLQAGEKPYVLVHAPGMKKGEETRVNITSEQDLETQGDLTDLGVAARDVLIRDSGAMAFGREQTPALKEDHVGLGLKDARMHTREALYVGAVNTAGEEYTNAAQPQKTIEIDGANSGYVKVVQPATPSLVR